MTQTAVGPSRLLEQARRLELEDARLPMILLAIEDVTERQRAHVVAASLAAIVNSSNDAIIGNRGRFVRFASADIRDPNAFDLLARQVREGAAGFGEIKSPVEAAGPEMQRLYAQEFGEPMPGADPAFCYASQEASTDKPAFCYASKDEKPKKPAFCYAQKEEKPQKPSFCYAAIKPTFRYTGGPDLTTRPSLA